MAKSIFIFLFFFFSIITKVEHGKYHMTVTESQRCDQSYRMVTSQSQHVTQKSGDGHEDCGRQDA